MLPEDHPVLVVIARKYQCKLISFGYDYLIFKPYFPVEFCHTLLLFVKTPLWFNNLAITKTKSDLIL